jgi:hypothetical protein
VQTPSTRGHRGPCLVEIVEVLARAIWCVSGGSGVDPAHSSSLTHPRARGSSPRALWSSPFHQRQLFLEWRARSPLPPRWSRVGEGSALA